MILSLINCLVSTHCRFDWCSWSSKRSDGPPAECYNRLSGVLFTNDRFKVTQNKLTFMDLELKVKDKSTLFTIVSKGQNTSRRGNIGSQFNQWLLNCHKLYDKQIKFMGKKGTIERQDKKKKTMDTWTAFSRVEWENRTFKEGELVKSYRKQPVLYGTVVHFLLHGNHKGDVFGAGGLVEIIRQPEALYNETRAMSVSNIDRTATNNAIKTNIDRDFLKFPKELKVEWPEGEPWPNNSVQPAGSVLGPIKVTILNGKGESVHVIPSGSPTTMNVKFTLTNPGEEDIRHVAQFSPKHGFWFKKIELKNIGKYTLMLNATVGENAVFGSTTLPSDMLKFTIKAGVAETFKIGQTNSPVRVGVPFDIPLEITDVYGHATEPPFKLQPVLTCSNLELSYTTMDDNKGNKGKFTIRSVKAVGKVQRFTKIQIKVTIPGLKNDTQYKEIHLIPGLPSSIYVTPKEDPVSVENGTSVMFHVEVHDAAGNITANPKQTVQCQVPGFPQQTIDCSTTGTAQFLTKAINQKITDGKPQTLSVSFKLPSHRAVNAVTRDLLVLPSTRVAAIEVRVNNDENQVLKPNEKFEWLAGGLLENLFYKLFDEAGREVALTEEIASKMQVNWTDINTGDLLQGKLPIVDVAKQVEDERFYQVSYLEQNVTFSFIVTPHPDEPKHLKVTLPESTVKLGETLSGDISLELVDMYGNATKSLTPPCVNQMNVEAEGLDKSAVTFTYQEFSSSVTVTGVCFKVGVPGPREMSFTYQNYVEHVIVKVTAGLPAKLTLISTPQQPLQLLNGTGSSTPFVVRVSDEWGNPCDQVIEVQIKTSPPGLTVTTLKNIHHMNAEGETSFIVNRVSGPKGYYKLTFEGSFNNTLIPGPSINVTVIPDPNKPVKLFVEYDKTAKLSAGQSFPVFSVTVVSEEGSPITTFEPSAVSMLLWKSESPGSAPPEDATEMMCSMPLRDDRNDCFYFRDKEIPVLLGGHIIQFSLRINNSEPLFSDQIPIHVVSGQPVKLGPEPPPANPVVSCCEDVAKRTLVEKLNLLIMDSYGNPAGRNLNGKVVVSIICTHGERNQNVPLFEGHVDTVQFDLVEGKAHIPRLAVMKNSPGENGSSYILKFKPEIVSTLLDPYELPFRFFNDAQNHQMVLELTKKKDELATAIARYKELFSTWTELLDLLTGQRDAASQKEVEIRNELRKKNVKIPQPASIATIDTLINGKTAAAEGIRKMQSRTCKIPDPFQGQQDVLGKVGHLAQVQDDNAARVISWNLSGSLDCVVTKTTEAAQMIHRDMRGKQQVLALDSILVSNDRPLPHIQNGRALFDPPGNPVLARQLLIYPQHEESCKILFKNLLGDTILIDDLESANQYRRMVVRNHVQCATILTRQGERVSARGIFGGVQNVAPPMSRLKLFGAPLPKGYNTLEEQKVLLTQYRSALQQKEVAERDRQKQLDSGEEIERQKQEMEEKTKQLKEIDRQLASLQAKPERRRLQEAPGSSGIAAKRTRM